MGRGRREPRVLPSGPYLLGHGGLHHACSVGLQAVAVVAIGVQLQKGPPGEGGEGTPGQRRDRRETGPQPDTQPLPVLNHRKTTRRCTACHVAVYLRALVRPTRQKGKCWVNTALISTDTNKQPPRESSHPHNDTGSHPRRSSSVPGPVLHTCTSLILGTILQSRQAGAGIVSVTQERR